MNTHISHTHQQIDRGFLLISQAVSQSEQRSFKYEAENKGIGQKVDRMKGKVIYACLTKN